MKIFIMIMILMLELNAMGQDMIVGRWQALTQTVNNGTKTIEKEYLHLNADHTFSIILLVSIQKDDAYIKDLHIEGSGIWKVRDNTLVIVIKQVEMPVAKEVYRISQESLENLAANFKRKFQNEPIRIIIIKNIEANHFTTINEEQKETSYLRQ